MAHDGVVALFCVETPRPEAAPGVDSDEVAWEIEKVCMSSNPFSTCKGLRRPDRRNVLYWWNTALYIQDIRAVTYAMRADFSAEITIHSLPMHALPQPQVDIDLYWDGSHKDSFGKSLETLSAVKSQSWVSF